MSRRVGFFSSLRRERDVPSQRNSVRGTNESTETVRRHGYERSGHTAGDRRPREQRSYLINAAATIQNRTITAVYAVARNDVVLTADDRCDPRRLTCYLFRFFILLYNLYCYTVSRTYCRFYPTESVRSTTRSRGDVDLPRAVYDRKTHFYLFLLIICDNTVLCSPTR